MERYQYSKKEQDFMEACSVPLAVYQFIDKRVVTIVLSQGLCDLLGIDSLEEAYNLMDTDMYRDTHPDDQARVADLAYQFATKGGEYKAIYRSKIHGEYHVISARGHHVTKEGGVRLAVVTYADEGLYLEGDDMALDFTTSLSQVVRERSQSYNLNYDYLTGLPSMTYFFELAKVGREEIAATGERPVLLFLDLSGMKNFNQKYGFAEGDNLIRAVAAVLKTHFHTENCGRFGSDHFAVYTSEVNLEDRLETLIEVLSTINNGMNLPVRIGVYKSGEEFIDVAMACDRAKMACDAIRVGHKSAINYFDVEMLRIEQERQYIIENVDTAISNGWIEVFYQAIIRTANGKVSDEEALARWMDPEHGVIMPSVFIPILEDAMLIYKLDLFVASKVINKMKNQSEAGLYVNPQSVNLSRSDFYSVDMVEEICTMADEAGVSHNKVTIELTESMVAEDINFIKEQVERFQDLGFRVWLDDYGSGYSSPDLLQKIHFDTIKFDMQFMKGFYEGNESRIILSELIKMAVALGIETVVEGVETKEQVDFLREVGCTKIQGHYYTQAISMENILERYKNGTQIGFENPEESDYYTSIGKVNLYDLSMTLDNTEAIRQGYFNTTPMTIVEFDGEEIWVVRSNPSFREFFKASYEQFANVKHLTMDEVRKGVGDDICNALVQCGKDGKNVLMDEKLPDGRIVHVLIRRISINPVSGVIAFTVVVLGLLEESENSGLTFTYVAQALSTDYVYFYYVDLDTESFIEYGVGDSSDNLSVMRHGEDFFAASHRDAEQALFEEDVEPFVQAFTKDNIIKTINENGSYTCTYRLLINGDPQYVHLKAVRIESKGNSVIIGVSNIDAQMKQQEAFERVKQERVIYSRVAALSDDYISIYTVDPETDDYNRFTESKAEEDNIGEAGKRFFETFREAEIVNIYDEDKKMFMDDFTKEGVFKAIKQKGIFSLNYRVVMDGEPVYVCVRAALTQENDIQQLIVGISNIDEQVKRDLEYVNNLTAARNEVNLDALTGVKSRHAYIDVEDQLDTMIEEGKVKDFAVAIFDINDLKKINDTFGHKAGDEYIQKGCAIICDIFRHCPVFRVGGDEFVVIIQGRSYASLDKLMKLVEKTNAVNKTTGDVVLAAGMARFERGDRNVAAVFERADVLMYENKSRLKGQE